MSAALRERWLKLTALLGWQGDAATVWDALHSRYTEPARAYHNLQHIAACLQAFDDAPTIEVDREPVELAIWFHDVIYDPRAKDNEAQSAEMFRMLATDAGLSGDMKEMVSRLIMTTEHKALPKAPEEKLLVDVDLSILGAEPDDFAEYERQIRKEYAWVAEKDFCIGRAAVLDQFVRREHIFQTSWFQQNYEAKARENLGQAIHRWRELRVQQ